MRPVTLTLVVHDHQPVGNFDSVFRQAYADAYGPLQFILPTWDRSGCGDINDIDDAAPAAARLLCANGYTSDRTGAIGQYNGGGNWRAYQESRNYVVSVDEFADAYRRVERPDLPSKQASGPSKERSAARLGERALAGWLNLGRNAQTVGLGSAWAAVDPAAGVAGFVACRFSRLPGEGRGPVGKAVVTTRNLIHGRLPTGPRRSPGRRWGLVKVRVSSRFSASPAKARTR